MAGAVIDTRSWAKELNQTNRAFWAAQSEKAQRRLADPVLLDRATADIEADAKRLIPLPFRKSIEQALQDAETLLENLAAIVPGGSPWNEAKGSLSLRCFSQALQLESMLLDDMGDPSTTLDEIRAAIALEGSVMAGTSPRTVGRFIGSDSGCSS